MTIRRRVIGSVVETVDGELVLPVWCREHRPALELVVETFLTDGTWTVPAGVTEATVELWGAGGGGTANTGGGGGGAYARSVIAADEASYAIVVGASADDTDGGDTTFDGSLVVAKGGLSATNGGTGGQASACTGDVAYDGGDGTLGTSSKLGGASAGAEGAASGTTAGVPNGAPAVSTAAAGRSPGAGGRSSTPTGYAGGGGEARVSYYVASDATYPTVVGRTWGRDAAAATSREITVPEGDAGDLLVLYWACDGDNDGGDDHTIDGWTRILVQAGSTLAVLAVFYKVATRGADAGVIITTDSEYGVWTVERYANAGTPTATGATATGTNADPPSHDAGESLSHQWVAVAAWDYSGDPNPTAGPAGYADILRIPGVNTGSVALALSRVEATAQTEDPGGFTSASATWAAGTVSIPLARIAPYRAAQGLVTDEGFFALQLVYEPSYAHDDLGAAETHTLIQFSDTASLYYDGDTATFVLDVGNVTLSSDAVTFSADQELTLDVEHTDERMRVRVRGATSGASRIDGDATLAAKVWSQIYLLGQKDTGSPWTGTLVSFRPTNADTFAELADQRILSQLDPDGTWRTLAAVFAKRKGRIHDTALTIRDAFDLEHADGDDLDMIGAVLVLPRHGFGDDRYRTFLQIQSKLLLAQARDDSEWTGTCENILDIARTFIGPDAGPIILTNVPPYNYQLDVPDLVLSEAELLVRFLRTATYAAVRGVVSAVLGDAGLWDSVEEDIDGGWIWDAVEEDIAGASVWGAVVTTD